VDNNNLFNVIPGKGMKFKFVGIIIQLPPTVNGKRPSYGKIQSFLRKNTVPTPFHCPAFQGKKEKTEILRKPERRVL
jgi:hypothetical protein